MENQANSSKNIGRMHPLKGQFHNDRRGDHHLSFVRDHTHQCHQSQLHLRLRVYYRPSILRRDRHAVVLWRRAELRVARPPIAGVSAIWMCSEPRASRHGLGNRGHTVHVHALDCFRHRNAIRNAFDSLVPRTRN